MDKFPVPVIPKGAPIAALNGILGDRKARKRKCRKKAPTDGLDVTDLVNPRAEVAGRDFYLNRWGNPARGGAGYFARRHFERWVRKQVDADRGVVFVGKSYGAHWIVDLIQRHHLGHLVHALLFDPSCGDFKGEDNRPIELSYPYGITVVRQLGPLSGYRVKGAEDIVIDAKHSTIERTSEARHILDQWLKKRWL